MRHPVGALFAVVVTLGVGCGTDLDVGGTDVEFPYDEIAEETQRPGDPAKGYDYLINGGYITCGCPRRSRRPERPRIACRDVPATT